MQNRMFKITMIIQNDIMKSDLNDWTEFHCFFFSHSNAKKCTILHVDKKDSLYQEILGLIKTTFSNSASKGSKKGKLYFAPAGVAVGWDVTQ